MTTAAGQPVYADMTKKLREFVEYSEAVAAEPGGLRRGDRFGQESGWRRRVSRKGARWRRRQGSGEGL